ncbi:hypothetical protein CDD80_160 [Ophiocordyceps camponoti-rufipedis]|uniref:ferric-chelate reductase (NADPH) n=1 Tax=Ophiocordyceps camponoti-rufipedis TaxID=2004952 RepID=A0A2C5ZDP5_9HYPO|nr:hypothetical protein CDD80_160 [Ophiocordyceps camponoti-rufipedis]
MAWTWTIQPPTLTPEAKHDRRTTINLYALLAHASTLAPLLTALLTRLLLLHLSRQTRYARIPTSPSAKAQRRTRTRRLRDALVRVGWWLDDDVVGFGRRDEWLAGLLWLSWLLTLSIHGTGTDFLHFTKRLGAVAVSQLPAQYALSLKGLNAYALAFGSSHERVNRFHGVLGRVIAVMLFLHVACYNYFFVAVGVWPARLLDWVVVYGVVAAVALFALVGTTVTFVRRASYRVFFVTHVIAALLVPPLIFFHAPSSRIYLIEALLAILADLSVRKFRSITAPSTLTLVPDASLVAIEAHVPPRFLRSVSASPGSHVYLSIPRGSRRQASASRAFDFLYNPFSVASVDDERGSITLVARVRKGPMTRTLARLASSSSAAKIPLTIDGPYGSIAHRLVSWSPSRILVIAGGVGATFCLPLYRFLREQLPTTRIRLVWSVRTLADAAWASNAGLLPDKDDDEHDFQLFVSGGVVAPALDDMAGTDQAVELRPLRETSPPRHHSGRPDLEKVVDSVFRQGLEDSVAVLVCGPVEMAADVRRRVRPWAMRGRDVWWHSESFG